MSVSSGPKISAKNNVILSIDSSSIKSFAGAPTTNVVGNRDLDINWSKGYCKNIVLNDLSVSKPFGVTTNVVSFENDLNVSGGSCFWYNYSDDTPQADNTTYSISIWARTKGQDIPIHAYTGDNSETGRKTTEFLTIVGNDTWQRLTWNPITTSNPNDSDSLSFRFYINSSIPGEYLPEGQRLYLCGPQMTPTNFHVPYVDGTRNSSSIFKNPFGNTSITTSVADLTYLSGNSFEFDGINDRFAITNLNYPTLTSDPFTIEAWVYVPSSASWYDSQFGSPNGTCIIARGSYAGTHGLIRTNVENTVAFWVRGADSLGSSSSVHSLTSTITRDSWYQIVGVSEGNNTLKLYVNGDLKVNRNTNLLAEFFDSGSWIVGGDYAAGGTNGGWGEGKYDAIRIYNKALNASEVKQNFNALRGRFGL